MRHMYNSRPSLPRRAAAVGPRVKFVSRSDPAHDRIAHAFIPWPEQRKTLYYCYYDHCNCRGVQSYSTLLSLSGPLGRRSKWCWWRRISRDSGSVCRSRERIVKHCVDCKIVTVKIYALTISTRHLCNSNTVLVSLLHYYLYGQWMRVLALLCTSDTIG